MPVPSQDLDFQCHMSWSVLCSVSWGDCCFVNIVGFVDLHCLNFLFIFQITLYFILCCVFLLFVLVLCTLCYQFLWIVLLFVFVLCTLCYQFLCFLLFVFVLCTLCYQFLWIVHFWLPLPYSLIIIDRLVNLLKMHEFCQILLFLGLEVPSYKSHPFCNEKEAF